MPTDAILPRSDDPKLMALLSSIEKELEAIGDEEIPVEQGIHAGCYIRTSFLRKGMTGVGALIQIPTVLIVTGHVVINSGNRMLEIKGHRVLKGEAHRKQVVTALEDSYLTMVFATKAERVDEAEEEFTAEAERLQSRRVKR
jgi:hypothetical protein